MAAPPTRGLVKAKKYDWKDSNLALFGSDTEKSIKKESAQTEAAWKGAGLKPGLQVINSPLLHPAYKRSNIPQ